MSRGWWTLLGLAMTLGVLHVGVLAWTCHLWSIEPGNAAYHLPIIAMFLMVWCPLTGLLTCLAALTRWRGAVGVAVLCAATPELLVALLVALG